MSADDSLLPIRIGIGKAIVALVADGNVPAAVAIAAIDVGAGMLALLNGPDAAVGVLTVMIDAIRARHPQPPVVLPGPERAQ